MAGKHVMIAAHGNSLRSIIMHLDKLTSQEVFYVCFVLPPFQIIRRFGFSTYIAFAMYLHIVYIYVHSKCNVSRKAKTSYNLEQRK